MNVDKEYLFTNAASTTTTTTKMTEQFLFSFDA
jgi:hypothetical protein